MQNTKLALTGRDNVHFLIILGLVLVAAYFAYSYFAPNKTTTAPAPTSGAPVNAQSAAFKTDPAEPSAETLSKWKDYISKLGVNSIEPLKPVHIVDNEDKTDTIRGIDADQNGIRDDIDRLIAEKYADTPQLKKAMEQSARVQQSWIESSTKEDAEKNAALYMNAMICINIALRKLPARSDHEERSTRWRRETEALYANTKQRFAAFRRLSKLLVDSSVQGMHEEDAVCDK